MDMLFSNEDVFNQLRASGLSEKVFYNRYYAGTIEFDAFRHRMKRIRAKSIQFSNQPKTYDMPSFQKAVKAIPDRFLKIAILPDIHFGDENPHAVELAYKIIEIFKPHITPTGNDELSYNRMTRHPTDPRHDNHARPDDLKEMIPYHQMHVRAITSAVPGTLLPFIYGNHDFWWMRQAMEDFPNGIETLEGAFVDGMRANGQVMYLGETDRIKIHNLMIQHISKGGVNPAKSNMAEYNYQESVIASHIHRRSIHTVAGPNRNFISVTTPCLCNLVPHYQGYIKKHTAWENGITLAEIDTHNLDQAPEITNLIFHEGKNKKMYARFYGQEVHS